jgi:N-acetylglucosamine kinase-like BadF-type ATPase
MTVPVVLAVDGGNSKTDLALVRADGAVLALVRGGMGSPHHIGVDGCVELLQGLFDDAVAQAGLAAGDGLVADVGQVLLAGLDLPVEEQALHEALARRGLSRRLSVGNDTFAVLRAGTERGWGVAVVCGAGINCVGVGPDGRHARFPALGAVSGDWGGGYDLGLAALGAAARSEDGRGPRTRLEQAVPAHFGKRTAAELGEAIHLGEIPLRRLVELPPVVFEEAGSDLVAAELVERLAAEVVVMAEVALRRLELADRPVEVLLGGGMFQHAELVDAVRASLGGVGGSITVRATAQAPIVGAALLGLDELGAAGEAQERVRRELAEHVGTQSERPVYG